MPVSPYPVTGRVYANSGTTALSNVNVICKNVSNNETQSMLSDANGDFIFDLANFPSGYSTGDEISLFASYGNYYTEVVFLTTISGMTIQNLTLSTIIESAALYCSVSEIRTFSGVGVSDFSDAAVYDMIKRATSEIDELTGRTWKGIQTVTDEYYDGDDTDLLWLNNTDIVSVTALSIDQNLSGTFSTVATTYVHRYQEGYIVLDRSSNITTFISGPQSVKLSYTYGNTKPTEVVRELAILMVTNMMKNDSVRSDKIDRIFEKIRWLGPRGLA